MLQQRQILFIVIFNVREISLMLMFVMPVSTQEQQTLPWLTTPFIIEIYGSTVTLVVLVNNIHREPG